MKQKTFREMSQLIPEITNRSDSIRKTLPPVLPNPTFDEFNGILFKLTKPELAGKIEMVELTAREAAILWQANKEKNQKMVSLEHSLKIAEDHGNARDVVIREYEKVNSIYAHRVKHLSG
jgi:hypothetical protein